MKHPLASAISTGALVLITMASGYWLSFLGRPLNPGVLALHKIIPTAAAVYIAVITIRTHRMNPLEGPTIVAAVVAAALMLVTIGTGAVLAMPNQTPGIVRTLHRISPYGTALAVLVFWLSVLRKGG